MFKIEKGIPLPPQRKQRDLRFPVLEMDVGDSVHIPGDHGDTKHKANVIAARDAVSYAKRTTGRSFTVRAVPDGHRIWRTA